MADAKDALELLSREPSVQRLAEMRRDAEIERQLDRADALAEGRAEGRTEGREEGRAALRETVVKACSVLGVPLDEARRARLMLMDEAALAATHEHLLVHRTWPG